MRGCSRRGWFPVALCAIALGWLTAAPAEAAFGPVDPEQLASAPRIDEARPWVSPLGEQLVFYREIEPQQVLGLRVRPSGGVFGPKQSLTGESNFEMPRDVSFDSAGEALATWGIATRTVHAQFARRAPGALFGPTQESPCYRFVGSSVGPHGELAVVCNVEVAANKFRLEFTEGSSLSAFPGGQAPLGPAIESEFLEPKVRYGADGTLAVAWRYEAGGKRFAEVAVRPPGSKALVIAKVHGLPDHAGAVLVGFVVPACTQIPIAGRRVEVGIAPVVVVARVLDGHLLFVQPRDVLLLDGELRGAVLLLQLRHLLRRDALLLIEVRAVLRQALLLLADQPLLLRGRQALS
jgi:hypothetical protein